MPTAYGRTARLVKNPGACAKAGQWTRAIVVDVDGEGVTVEWRGGMGAQA